jgi:hypothetical protein
MFRTRVALSALCLALTTPVLGNEPATVLESRPQPPEVLAAASGLPTSAWKCSAPEVTVPYNEEFYWRWMAHRELDCAIEAIERAMKSADSEEGTVTLRREELEYLRARAFSAKDAAARIGR